ncbi:MAG: LapA family protein [Methylococcales bacterium]|nr:LapA family protein [Methylococcales bacterium]
MKLIILILFLVIFIVALIFSVMNFHLVQINLGFGSISLPLTIALTIELFVGIMIGLLVAWFQVLKLKTDYAHLNKQLNQKSKKD